MVQVAYMYEMHDQASHMVDGQGLVKFDEAYVSNSYFVQNL